MSEASLDVRIEVARRYGEQHGIEPVVERAIKEARFDGLLGGAPAGFSETSWSRVVAILTGDLFTPGFVAEKLQELKGEVAALRENAAAGTSHDASYRVAISHATDRIQALAEALGLQEDGDQPEGDHCTCWHHEGRRTGWDEDSPCALHPDDGPRGKDGRDG